MVGEPKGVSKRRLGKGDVVVIKPNYKPLKKQVKECAFKPVRSIPLFSKTTTALVFDPGDVKKQETETSVELMRELDIIDDMEMSICDMVCAQSKNLQQYQLDLSEETITFTVPKFLR